MIRPVFQKHKNNKLLYYASAFFSLLLPAAWFRKRLPAGLNRIHAYDEAYIADRVGYYNKLSEIRVLDDTVLTLKEYKLPRKLRVYYFDSQRYLRYFKRTLRVNVLPGDITYVPEKPTLVKSRPIHGLNENSVLLKLNEVRHFIYVKDTKAFVQKKNLLIGRGVVKVPHRVKFYEQYFNHPLCDLGQINRGRNEQWIKPKLTIDQHLDYKFILCLEGYDVATNLKWVMSSSSLAVMPEPTYESWFMEGRLIPGYHYVRIESDYSDLEAQLNYYIEHETEALAIIRHANEWVQQFKDNRREDLISLMVLDKYFRLTGQQP
jgi:hypothetical protein